MGEGLVLRSGGRVWRQEVVNVSTCVRPELAASSGTAFKAPTMAMRRCGGLCGS
jgi:hypothetical protein